MGEAGRRLDRRGFRVPEVLAQRAAAAEIGTLAVGFFNGGTGPDVPAIIKIFRRLHHDVRVTVVDMVPGLQSTALVNGTMDVGFTRQMETPFDQLLRSEIALS